MPDIFLDINGVVAFIKRPERLQQVKDALVSVDKRGLNKFPTLRKRAAQRLETEKKILTDAHLIEFTQSGESFLVALRPGAREVIKAASALGQLYTLTDSTVDLISRTCHILAIDKYFRRFYCTRDEDRLPPQVAQGMSPWLLISKNPFDRKLKMLGVQLSEDGDVDDAILQEHVIHPTLWSGADEDPQPMLDLAQILQEKLT